jgi:hypothetical protein
MYCPFLCCRSYVQIFLYRLFISVLDLVIQLSRGQCWDLIYRFCPAIAIACRKPGPAFP